MKNLYLMIAVAAMFTLNACGQASKNVPEKAKAAFSQKFPNASKVKWDKENSKEWEAKFKMNGKEYSANFSIEGNWKETEYKIEKSEIPVIVKNTLDNQFSGFKIKESEISETVKATVYEFELKKGKTVMEVAIDIYGKVIRKEVKKENSEEDKD